MCNVFTTLVKDGFEDFAHMIENDYENTITNEKETYASNNNIRIRITVSFLGIWILGDIERP